MAVVLLADVSCLSVVVASEIFPYLVVVIGLENVLVVTKSVVSTPVHLDVKLRVAQGQCPPCLFLSHSSSCDHDSNANVCLETLVSLSRLPVSNQ